MTPDSRKRVLFLCIGNCCRSQMAEGFARTHGSDVLIAASAGIVPTAEVAQDTRRAMAEKHIDLSDHFPKSLRHLSRAKFDLIVNMSGLDVSLEANLPLVEWQVEDPYLQPIETYREVRDHIERLVMDLVLRLRAENAPPQGGPAPSG